MKFYSSPILFVLALSASANAALVNYVVTGYASGSAPIVDTGVDGTTDVTDPASGGPKNTVLIAAGPATYVDFTIGNADAIVGDKFLAANINALPTVATLRVTLQQISASGTEIMIARTSDSQGLTDVGTVTLLLTGLDGENEAQVNSATFGFEWRNAANDALLGGSDSIIFSSYDLDFGQRNTIPTADISVYGITTPTSGLTVTSSGSDTIFRDAPPEQDTVVTDPLGAYAFVTNPGDNNQTITVDKTGATNSNGNQLYMFSFRSPSPLVDIPEPSSALMAGLGALALLRRRRN